MSLTARHSAYLIGTGTVFSATPTLVDEVASLTEEGFDTLHLTYFARRAVFTAEECAAAFPQGAQIGSRKFWIANSRPIRIAPGFWSADVICKGWASTKPAKIRVGAGADMQTANNVIAPAPGGGTGTYPSFATVENTPTVSVSYLAEDLDTTANTASVGREFALPAGVTVDVASSVWLSLATPTYHWPHGWVLMGSAQDRIPGTDVGFVTDDYRYVRALTPGG